MSEFDPEIKRMFERAGDYPPQAYQFIREGLAHTVKSIHGEGDRLLGADGDEASLRPDDNRHISGQQLCLGLRDFAVRQYGMLARTVLRSWNISRTEDFGRIVFAMIDEGFMRKTDDDKIQDFEAVFDFDEAFQDLSRTPSR